MKIRILFDPDEVYKINEVIQSDVLTKEYTKMYPEQEKFLNSMSEEDAVEYVASGWDIDYEIVNEG